MDRYMVFQLDENQNVVALLGTTSGAGIQSSVRDVEWATLQFSEKFLDGKRYRVLIPAGYDSPAVCWVPVEATPV